MMLAHPGSVLSSITLSLDVHWDDVSEPSATVTTTAEQTQFIIINNNNNTSTHFHLNSKQ